MNEVLTRQKITRQAGTIFSFSVDVSLRTCSWFGSHPRIWLDVDCFPLPGLVDRDLGHFVSHLRLPRDIYTLYLCPSFRGWWPTLPSALFFKTVNSRLSMPCEHLPTRATVHPCVGLPEKEGPFKRAYHLGDYWPCAGRFSVVADNL